MPYTTLVSRDTGLATVIDDNDLPAALASGQYISPASVAVHLPGAGNTYVPPSVAAQDASFSPVVAGSDIARAHGHQIREDAHSDVGSTLKAIGGGAVKGVSAGLVSPFEDDQEFHPYAAGGAQLVGAIAPAFLGDEAGLAGLAPTSLISRGGAATAEALGGGLAARTAAGVGEGLAFSGAGLAGDYARATPEERERILANIPSNLLLGAGVGGLAGAAGHGLSKVLTRTADAAEASLASRVATEGVDSNLASLDAKGLRAAESAEMDKLAAAQVTERAGARAQAVDDLVAYRAAVKDANPWLVINEGENSARLTGANKLLRNALDDVKGLQERIPDSVAKALRKEEAALESTIADRQAVAAKIAETNTRIATDLESTVAALPEEATHVELTGKAAQRYGSYADVKVKRNAPVSVPREDAAQFIEALKNGEVGSASGEALDALPTLLEKNRALQNQIRTVSGPLSPRSELTSGEITQIRAARDALSAPKPEASLIEKAASGGLFGALTGAAAHIPLVGQIPGVAHLLGAKGSEMITGALFGRLSKVSAESAARTAEAVKSFVGAVQPATKYAPVIATQVLSHVRYAAPEPASRGETPSEPKTLPALFKARTDEIKSQTAYNAQGIPKMRPAAREAMARTFNGIRAQDPLLADQLETLAARRIEYLSSLIPRRPDFGTPQIGPDTWHPPSMAMRSFARSAAAAEDPDGVEARAIHGGLSMEDVRTYHAVYPERAQSFTGQIMSDLAVTKRALPYKQRLTLGMLIGRPIDPTSTPRIKNYLQAMYASEVGSQGGTAAPKATPKFGSVAKSLDQPTPAQSRAARI